MMHWMEIASDILLEGQELYFSGGFKNTQRVVLVQSGKPPQDVHQLFSDLTWVNDAPRPVRSMHNVPRTTAVSHSQIRRDI